MFKRLRRRDEAMDGSSMIRAAAAASLLLAVPAAAPSQRPAQYGQSVVREPKDVLARVRGRDRF